MAWIKTQTKNGKKYYSVVENIIKENGKVGLKTLKSFKTDKPTSEDLKYYSVECKNITQQKKEQDNNCEVSKYYSVGDLEISKKTNINYSVDEENIENSEKDYSVESENIENSEKDYSVESENIENSEKDYSVHEEEITPERKTGIWEETIRRLKKHYGN